MNMQFNYEDWHKATYQHCEDPTEYQDDEEKFYCEECFEEDLGDEHVEQEDGTILCYGCDSKRLIKEN